MNNIILLFYNILLSFFYDIPVFFYSTLYAVVKYKRRELITVCLDSGLLKSANEVLD